MAPDAASSEESFEGLMEDLKRRTNSRVTRSDDVGPPSHRDSMEERVPRGYAKKVEHCFGILSDEFESSSSASSSPSRSSSPPSVVSSSTSGSDPSSSSGSSSSSESSSSTESSSSFNSLDSSDSSLSEDEAADEETDNGEAADEKVVGKGDLGANRSTDVDAMERPKKPTPWELNLTIRRPTAPACWVPPRRPATVVVRGKTPGVSLPMDLEHLYMISEEILEHTRKRSQDLPPHVIKQYTTNDYPSRKRKRRRRKAGKRLSPL